MPVAQLLKSRTPDSYRHTLILAPTLCKAQGNSQWNMGFCHFQSKIKPACQPTPYIYYQGKKVILLNWTLSWFNILVSRNFKTGLTFAVSLCSFFQFSGLLLQKEKVVYISQALNLQLTLRKYILVTAQSLNLLLFLSIWLLYLSKSYVFAKIK